MGLILISDRVSPFSSDAQTKNLLFAVRFIHRRRTVFVRLYLFSRLLPFLSFF